MCSLGPFEASERVSERAFCSSGSGGVCCVGPLRLLVVVDSARAVLLPRPPLLVVEAAVTVSRETHR